MVITHTHKVDCPAVTCDVFSSWQSLRSACVSDQHVHLKYIQLYVSITPPFPTVRKWEMSTVADGCLFHSVFVTTGKVLHEEHVELLMEEFAFLKKEVVGKDLLKGSLLFTGQSRAG